MHPATLQHDHLFLKRHGNHLLRKGKPLRSGCGLVSGARPTLRSQQGSGGDMFYPTWMHGLLGLHWSCGEEFYPEAWALQIINKLKTHLWQMWWNDPAVPELGRLRQENHNELRVNLGYKMKPYAKKPINQISKTPGLIFSLKQAHTLPYLTSLLFTFE